MTVPAYTMRTAHPYVFFLDSEKSAIAARVADSAGWKTLYDNTIKPAATSYKGYAAGTLAANSEVQNRLMVLLLVAWLEETGRPDGGYRDKAVDAAVALCAIPDDQSPTYYRNRLLALAAVFDVCFDWLTSSEKSTIAAEIVHQASRCTAPVNEYMHGHGGNDQMCALAGGLAISGYHSSAASIINRALEFWWGTGATGTADGGRWEMPRHSCSDGGDDQGSWYNYLMGWAEVLIPHFMSHATTDVDPFVSEVAWMKKRWEWHIWSGWTGTTDHDFDAQGDVYKLSGTYFHWQQRIFLAIVADKFRNNDSLQGGHMLAWLFAQWDALDSSYADSSVWQILFLDRAAVTTVHPKDATTVPSCSRLFNPPGVYYGRWAPSGEDDWDYDESCVFRISARQWYYLGHTHLDAGSVMIHFKGDRILQAPAGIYSDYGDSHHMNAYQRSWLQSLVPLIHDPSAVWNRYSTLAASDGGQQFKKSTYTDRTSDPGRMYYMLNDGGGETWLRTRSFEKVQDDHPTTMTFLVADLEPAYRKYSTDSPRCSVCEVKYLIIWPNATNGLTWPALLYYARIVKSDSDWRTQIPFHSYQAWTTTSYGAHTTGYRSVGKLWVDIYNHAAYTKLNVPPGTPLDANNYGPDQFRIYGDGAANWKPSRAAKTRELPDLCRHSLYIEKTTRTTQEDYVMLLMLSGSADSEPVTGRSWVTETDWYGITLGADIYRIHKTQDLAVHGSPDTTPPAEVTGLALTARDRGILARWTDPADSDLNKIRIFKRTSAIT
jgi:hypothetical protein